jgi:AcrR family transcriptional regulator
LGRRSEHTLEQIKDMAIEAAEAIVVEQGLEHLTTRKIAAKMGYTSGTLYLVFKNVDDLVLQINGRSLDKLAEKIRKTAQSSPEPKARIQALCLTYLDFADAHPGLWSLVFENRWRTGFVRPEWYQHKKYECFKPLEQALSDLAKDKSPEELAMAAGALWGGIHGIHNLASTGKLEAARPIPEKKLALYHIDVFLKGFLK